MMPIVAIVVTSLAALLGLSRWLRVSQREHYIPGQVFRTARRWVTVRPPNQPIAALWLGVTVVTVGLAVAGVSTATLAVGIVAGLIGGVFPFGLALLGKVRLKLTRRARTQGLVALVLTALVVAGVALGIGGDAGLGAATALVPFVALVATDVAALLNLPFEKRRAAKFQAQAQAKLERIAPTVVAITGSYGKTTVKNHVRDLLVSTFTTVASPESWNNQAGLSRAVNEHMGPDTEVFIAEMGTYGPGEIKRLVSWIKPKISVITAIGPVHLERMGSLENIAQAKSEILEGAEVAVLCVDHPQLDRLATEVEGGDTKLDVWRVGSDWSRTDLDVLVEPKPDTNELVITVRGDEFTRILAGSLQPGNVGCAVAAALAAGAVPERVVAALPTLVPPPNRAVPMRSESGVVVIDDTFNANPAGARAAFENLQRLAAGGRQVVITPGMIELGDSQADENREFAYMIAQGGGNLVVVGWTNRASLMSGHPTAEVVRNREAARKWVRANLRLGDAVLWENDLPDHYP